ncbi:PAS domain-containing protein [Methylobacterium sp. E-016]|uniref:PAS domain-containing protein n=1 Tax=Methylobacterium sp. E-016 TaxID=2836556 RepID=UPI001FBA3E95|nr:PAS domain-containing protein [Methylobacterium sp. E-016]MCJ2076578.1 PAS domain-containing protein [Methylobacterium sp. E-016]
MPKNKTSGGRTCPAAFQSALDALDVVGRWEWDATTDLARVDAFVALLFNVDPEEAEEGLPLSRYIDAIHSDDRQRVLELIRSSASASSAYLTEYRVISVDGRTRWVLARGRFTGDHRGQPQGGSGIFIDITQMRMSEGTFGGGDSRTEASPLDRAADHAIAAQKAIVDLQDPDLKVFADTLLVELGRRLARQEVRERRKHMN